MPRIIFSEITGGPIGTEMSETAIKDSWTTSFTDPTNFDPSNFVLLVHGIQPERVREFQRRFMHDLHVYREELDINLLREPNRIGEKLVIAASVISHFHTPTWGDAGFILTTPPRNVLRAGVGDFGTSQTFGLKDPESIRKKLCTVDRLLQACDRGEKRVYNEVDLRGRTEEGDVKIVGCFIKVDDKDRAVEFETTAEIIAFAERFQLPIVQIREVEFQYPDADVELLSGEYMFNRNGLRYIYNPRSGLGQVVIGMDSIRPMASDEVIFAKRIISEQVPVQDN